MVYLTIYEVILMFASSLLVGAIGCYKLINHEDKEEIEPFRFITLEKEK